MRTTLLLSIPLCVGLAMSAAQAQPGALETVEVKTVARFGFDSAAVSAADRVAMMAEVAKMTDVTWQTVTATGHTDNIGSAAYNQRLSQRRAQAVRSYLLSRGLDPSMVQAQGKAFAEPVADNAVADGRASNRRADIRFRGVRSATR